jgi:hypothetical protein
MAGRSKSRPPQQIAVLCKRQFQLFCTARRSNGSDGFFSQFRVGGQ